MSTELPQPRDQRLRAPSLGQAVRELPQPQSHQHSALSERVAVAMGSQTMPTQESQAQGEQGGGRRGGQERPSHPSYYQPVPAGEMAPPQPERRRRNWDR